MSETIKKVIAGSVMALAAVAMTAPSASALTIAELEAQIAALQAQLQQLVTQQSGGTTTTGGAISGVPSTFTFEKSLSVGDTGNDVKYLQIVLNSDAATQLASSGAGSPGNETMYFGPITKAGVVKFQEKYASDVLAPYNLTQGTGYVGTTTRAKLNELLASSSTDEGTTDEGTTDEGTTDEGTTDEGTTDEGTTDEGTTDEGTGVEGNTLQVTLANDTPAAMTVADNANTNFTKLVLTTGEQDVSVSSLYVTRYGLSSNSDVENIKVVDADGIKVGSVGTLNSNSKAQISFVPSLKLSANTVNAYYIRAGIVDDATAGKTIALGIASGSDVSAGSATVQGNFPVKGNSATIVNLTIGTAQVTNDGTVTDSSPNVGDEDVVVNQFKVTAGTTEAITVESITMMESGTASLSDTKNIELYDVSKGQSIGTVESWTSDGKASWTGLGIKLAKGEVRRFRVQVDVVGGSGLNINTDLSDGGDVLMSVKGDTYGFYITPSVTGSWSGKGANAQEIASGSLTVSKSASTPAVGNIAPASGQKLASFDFQVQGESVKITSLKFSFDTTGIANQTLEEITNVKLYDENDELVAGPQSVNLTDYSPNSTTYEDTVTFTDVIIVPTGTHAYTVKADIAASTSTGDTVKVAIADVGDDITATGMNTNTTISATPDGELNANQQTVAAGALATTTLTQPAARSVVAGTQDYVWATASLSAGSSGEDVLVTAVTLTDTAVDNGGDGIETGDMDNFEIWADLTADNSTRGDAYETKVSQTKQFTDGTATLAFTLTQSVTVPKGSFVKIAAVGDLATGAEATDTHTVKVSAVTATGSDTGSSLTGSANTVSGSGQLMTVASSGTLTVSVDASSPSASLVNDSAEKVTLAVFKLAADNVENLDLDSIKITASGASDAVSQYYFYSSSRSDGVSTDTAIQTITGGSSSAEVQIGDGAVTIPANGSVKITVKANLNNIDGTQVQNGDTIGVYIAASGDIDTTGLGSGQAVDSTDTTTPTQHSMYEAYPVVTVASSPSVGTTITQSTNQLAAVFQIEAKGDKNVTFQNADGNKVIFQVTVVGDDTDTGNETITFKDESGNTLDTGTIDSSSGTSELTVDFSSNDLTVPAGSTKKILVYADTSDLEAGGNILNVWLDATAGDIDFGADGANFTNTEGDKIFKGGIYGPTLQNSSNVAE